MRQAIPDHTYTLTDEDLWSAFDVPKHGEGAQHLAAAVEAGKAGSRPRAYRELVAYHRVSLAQEWQRIREGALNAPAPDAAMLEDLLNNKIRCWHNQVVQFGDKIDWAPRQLPSASGFHYFGWFGPAVTAFVQTGEQRYRDWIADVMTQYYHDARRDSRWQALISGLAYNRLSIACKLPAVLSGYLVLVNSGDVSTGTAEGFAKMFLSFGRQLDAQLKEFTAHNIETAACRGLLTLARLFPEFKQSGKWDRKAIGRLCRQVKEGFHTDGCHRERVWGYGYGTLSSIVSAYDTAQRHGGLGKHEKEFLKGIRKAYRFYARTLGPKNMMPSYGDAGPPHDASAILQAGRRFFPKGTGEDLGMDRTKSSCLKDSGFAIMRNGNAPGSSYVNVNFGRYAGWHSHQDLLSMNFWSQGVPLLEELSRFGPYASTLDTLFRAPDSHNLLLIDGMIYDCRNVQGRDVAWHSCDEVDYFSAWHRAYGYWVYGKDNSNWSFNIEGKVRRTILMVKDPGYVLVLDSVTDLSCPDFRRAVTQVWHSPRQFRAVGPTQVRTKGREGCLLAWAHADGLKHLETGVDFLKDETAELGASYDRYSLRARRWMPLHHRGIVGFTTLLYPFTGRPPQVSIKPLKTEGGGLWRTEAVEITTPRGKDTIVLNPERVDGFRFRGREVAGRGLVKLGGRRGKVAIP